MRITQINIALISTSFGEIEVLVSVFDSGGQKNSQKAYVCGAANIFALRDRPDSNSPISYGCRSIHPFHRDHGVTTKGESCPSSSRNYTPLTSEIGRGSLRPTAGSVRKPLSIGMGRQRAPRAASVIVPFGNPTVVAPPAAGLPHSN